MLVLSRFWRAEGSLPSSTTTSQTLVFICRGFSTTLENTGIDLIACTSSSSLSHRSLSLNNNNEDVKGRHVQWLFLGCPGVCKGTYASRLSNLLGVPHIATGDLVRQALASSGSLAPQSRPVEEFYRSRGKLLEFDLPGGIPEWWPKLLQALNIEDLEDKQSAAA